MPELPEVETVARGVARLIRGERIESVWLSGKPQSLKSPARLIVRTLEGAAIKDVRRVGKHIVFDLERDTGEPSPHRAKGGLAGDPKSPVSTQARFPRAKMHPQWIVHLGMTGSLVVVEAQREVEKHTHAVLRLGSGRELRFVDPRRFGKLAIAREEFRAKGHEPLDVDADVFAEVFHRSKAPIKSALLNQKLLSGVGNIYADEALFRAEVRPRRRAHTLTRDELKRLYGAVQQVLNEGIAAGGTTVNDYMNALGEAGMFQFDLRVYGRDGEACLVCRTPIKRIVISGRSAHYCAKCQK